MNPIALKLKSGMMKMPTMLTCREFDEFVSDYFEGNLSGYRNFKFALHMKMCSPCRRYIEAYRRSQELGKQVFGQLDAEVPPEVPEELVEAILEAQKKR